MVNTSQRAVWAVSSVRLSLFPLLPNPPLRRLLHAADYRQQPACGPTHTAVTPLDLVKCRRQVDPKLYSSNLQAWSKIYRGEGLRGVFFGWSPTLVGYCFQGGGKYGFYEVFKYSYGEQMFPNANKTVIFLAASASAEFIADIFLCPFEAVKVRMQTSLPPFANTMREGISKVVQKEGYAGYVYFYCLIVPTRYSVAIPWCR